MYFYHLTVKGHLELIAGWQGLYHPGFHPAKWIWLCYRISMACQRRSRAPVHHKHMFLFAGYS